ncbi:hypothetical protein [Nostoc sp.]|uniref:hypothetical protein n=1 Tax=Nostoc sp. TaxID=1180 RepID=UPI002FFA8544
MLTTVITPHPQPLPASEEGRVNLDFSQERNPKGVGGVGGVGGWRRSLTPHTPHTPHTPLPLCLHYA